jgi:hypothetical protein
MISLFFISRTIFPYLAILSFALENSTSIAAVPPTRIGQCSNTFVQEVTSRFGAQVGEFGSEDSVLTFTNGLGLYLYRKLRTQTTPSWGISEESNPIELAAAAIMFRPNDKVKICLEYIPQDCDYRKKFGDRRGEIYYISNYRNSVSAYGHLGRNGCGGA